MTPAEGIAKLGFRRWYERELIEGHVYLITCFLALILIAVCLEQIDWRGPVGQLTFTLSALALGTALCAGGLRRYTFILRRAEHLGEQSSCGQCGTYGVLKVMGAGVPEASGAAGDIDGNTWIRVQCKKCGHEWRMQDER